MNYGFPVVFSHRSIVNGIAIAGSLDFDFVDIIIDTPGWLDENAGEILDALEEYSLEAGVQSPWETIFLSSPWEGVRRGCQDTIVSTARFAAGINAAYFNIHIRKGEGWFEEESITLSRTVKTLNGLRQKIHNVGKLTLENSPSNLFSNLENYLTVVKNSGLSACVDIGHLLASHDGKTDALREWTSRLNDRIYSAHLSVARIREKEWSAHYKPTSRELHLIIDQLRSCKSLKYLVFEFFKDFSTENEKNKAMKRILDLAKATSN